MADLATLVRQTPRAPGVYLWKHGNEVLYVGKAIDLRARTQSYLSDAGHKATALMAQSDDLEYIAVRNEKEALILEQTLIKRHRPRYNVILKDDKQYPFIALTAEPYPRLVKTHRHIEGAIHFGPFPDGYGAYHVMQALHDLLPLRRCKTLPKEKCLYYDIGKCIAPCIEACTDAEYDALVTEARDLLRGKAAGALRALEAKMASAADEERFEEAARLRDQLQGMRGVLERQHMVAERLEDRDIASLAARAGVRVVAILHQREGKVVGQSAFVLDHGGDDDDLAMFLRGYYSERSIPRFVTLGGRVDDLEADLRLLAGHAVTVETPERGEKRRWLEVAATNAALRLEQELAALAKRGMGAVEALGRALGIAPPRVIEGFDISHHAGAHTRAAMVRFVDGEPEKAGYRTFNMRDVPAGEVDDYASIKEAVSRRYRDAGRQGAPDLVLVDGGKGQLAAALSALKAVPLDVPLVALAKREEIVHQAGRIMPHRWHRDDAALQLLQRVRDEAHRFGITQVRNKARTTAGSSPLDAVRGIGPKRRAELVRLFGGLEGLRHASIDDLRQVPGVTVAMAEAVVAALRRD